MKQPLIYSFTAFSGVGKTTYLERLIPELKARGMRVGVIKHHGHDTEFDHKEKDSWRFSQAGADVTALISPIQSAFFENRELEPEEAAKRISDVDIILTEGYKHGPWPKIAICREGKAPTVPLDNCAAVVSDVPMDCGVQVFSLDDPASMADWLDLQADINRRKDR